MNGPQFRSRAPLVTVGTGGFILAAIAAIAAVVANSQAKPDQSVRSISAKKASNGATTEERDAEYKKSLEYHVTRERGTEPAFSGKYLNSKGEGVYKCVSCKTPIFDSKTKFDSGTGWPSFFEPIDEKRLD